MSPASTPDPDRVSDSSASTDSELREHVQRTLAAGYDVEREIGRGGMGVVYRAIDRRLKRPVAIKLLPPELAFRRDIRQRFQREAETAAQLSHAHIVPIYSVDEIDNLVFFVMACVDGDNLATQLKNRGPLPHEDVSRYLLEVSDALAYAHSRGVIHRDIKPDNILIDALDGRAMVTDFGIARAAEGGEGARLTATGLAIGTPAYMSPEQASGDRDVDGRSDLYSLGVVAYQMLTGMPPFNASATPALLVKHLTELPTPIEQLRPDVPPVLAAMVMRLLEKDPEHRFQGAAEFSSALRSGTSASARFSLASGGAGKLATQSRQGVKSNGTAAAGVPSHNRSATLYNQQSDEYLPTGEEMARWEVPAVQSFRKKLTPFLFVNVPLVAVSAVSGSNFLPVTTVWTIILSYQYAKLWSDGYDWRDVLRQPRYRMFGDVISDVGDSIQSAFSKKKREELRAQGRTGSGLRGALSARSPVPALQVPVTPELLGAHASVVGNARATRDEIVRLLSALPESERKQVPTVSKTADSLVEKVEQLARSLMLREQTLSRRTLREMDDEIARLEAEANPMEAGSEARVRRLAFLRRERRSTVEYERMQEELKGKIDSCTMALENIRLDLVRLRTGGSTIQGVTLIAQQAMQVASDVDRVVDAAREVREIVSPLKANAVGRAG